MNKVMVANNKKNFKKNKEKNRAAVICMPHWESRLLCDEGHDDSCRLHLQETSYTLNETNALW